MKKPINVLTGIDYWLDQLMCTVPEVVMCYHLNGIVQVLFLVWMFLCSCRLYFAFFAAVRSRKDRGFAKFTRFVVQSRIGSRRSAKYIVIFKKQRN